MTNKLICFLLCCLLPSLSYSFCDDQLTVYAAPIGDVKQSVRLSQSIVQAMAAAVGQTPKLKGRGAWQLNNEQLLSATADIIFATQANSKFLLEDGDYSLLAVTSEFRLKLVGRKGAYWRDFSSLNDKTLVTVKDTPAESITLGLLAAFYPHTIKTITLRRVRSGDMAMMAVLRGQGDFAAVAEVVLHWLDKRTIAKVTTVADLGELPGILLLAGSCLNGAQQETLRRLLLKPKKGGAVEGFLSYLSLGHFREAADMRQDLDRLKFDKSMGFRRVVTE